MSTQEFLGLIPALRNCTAAHAGSGPIAGQGKWMRASSETNFTVVGLAAIVGFLLLLPVMGRAQTAATGCTLDVEGSGGTGVVMVNASGCAGDVAIIAKAGSNQKQFAVGSGGEVYQPFNLSP